MSIGRLGRRLVDLYRRRRWLAWAISAALPMGVAWWSALRDPAQTAPAVSAHPAPSVPLPASAPASAVPLKLAAASLPLSAPTLPAGGPHWDLCGIGRLPVPPGTKAVGPDGRVELPAHLGTGPAAEAIVKTVSKMQAGDARARAAALLLVTASKDEREAVAELQAMGAATADPVIVLWALQRCPARSACSSTLAARWVALEPDNAAAWLWLMDAQPARRAEAARALLDSSRYDERDREFLAAFLAGLPPDMPPYLGPATWEFALGLQAALPMPTLAQAMAMCPAAGPGDGPRPPHCAHLARLLTETADTYLAYQMGITLGRRVGWPADRIEALQAALPLPSHAPASASSAFEPTQPLACEAVNGMRSLLELRARRGEVGMLRETAAAGAVAVAPPASR